MTQAVVLVAAHKLHQAYKTCCRIYLMLEWGRFQGSIGALVSGQVMLLYMHGVRRSIWVTYRRTPSISLTTLLGYVVLGL